MTVAVEARPIGFDAVRAGDRRTLRAAKGEAGLAALAPLLDQLAGAGEVSALDWEVAGPAGPEEEAELLAITTRCRLLEEGRGRIDLALELASGGVVRGRGRCAILAPTALTAPLDAHLRTDFCSRAWAELMVARLADSVEFPAATSGFDGAIELAAGEEAIQLRIYRGAVLEVARSTPAGPTFTLAGSELEWVGLARAPRNDFIARTMGGAFEARGDRYQYVRLTRALVALWDEVRALAAGAMR